MKRLGSVVVLFAIIPQVALAAWWNPLSWNFWIFLKPNVNKEEVLRERIDVLEKKLEEVSSVPTTTAKEIIQADTSSTASLRKSAPNKDVANAHDSLPETIDQQTLSINDLLDKYEDFRAEVSIEKDKIDRRSTFSVEKKYWEYLRELFDKLNSNIGYLSNYEYASSIPPGIISLYANRLEQLKSEYVSEKNDYPEKLNNDKLITSKNYVIDYIEENKQYLYQPDIHVRAAELLYMFDKLSNTQYARDFESKKTKQETIEFANRFLIDQF